MEETGASLLSDMALNIGSCVFFCCKTTIVNVASHILFFKERPSAFLRNYTWLPDENFSKKSNRAKKKPKWPNRMFKS